MSAEDPADAAGYLLLGPDGRPFCSPVPGTLGGHRRTRVYGRLDCRSAARALAAGGYVRSRVFFADEGTARAAGYRPCAVCLPEAYRTWRCERPPGGWWSTGARLLLPPQAAQAAGRRGWTPHRSTCAPSRAGSCAGSASAT